MGVSYRQLRERCQLPVRQHNDVAGLLFGDFASLPITKLFVDGDSVRIKIEVTPVLRGCVYDPQRSSVSPWKTSSVSQKSRL